MPSIVLNLLTAGIAVAAVCAHVGRSSLKSVLRFFTVHSNLLCAAASLAVALSRLLGGASAPALLFKFIGTVAVTVTLLTVLLFLGPHYGYKLLFTGPDLWLHLLCPLMALISYFAWDRPALSPLTALLGMLPVLLYGLLYMYQVVYAKRWEDFYGFNRGGKWPLSFAVMLAGTGALCLLLAATGA